jgi:hypothetical protein
MRKAADSDQFSITSGCQQHLTWQTETQRSCAPIAGEALDMTITLATRIRAQNFEAGRQVPDDCL